MITEWIVTVASGLFAFLGDLMPDWEIPAELAQPGGFFAQIFALGQGTAPFVDWAFVSAIAAIPLVVWLIGLSFRAIKTLISHIPFFGGN